MEYDLAHNIIAKTQTHQQGVVNNHDQNLGSAFSVDKTNYHLQYNDYATGVNNTNAYGASFGNVQPHAVREIIETPSDSPLNENHPSYNKQTIEYDANGNQTEISRILVPVNSNLLIEGVVQQEEVKLRKYIWDEENRLRGVNTNPENSQASVAVYTYGAGGDRVIKHVPGKVRLKTNANGILNTNRDEVILYPNPNITVKALTPYGMAPTINQLLSKYTKHYYMGSERINSSLGTARNVGLYPKLFVNSFTELKNKGYSTIIPIRNLADLTTIEATQALIDTYTDLNNTISIQAPANNEAEAPSSFVHDNNLFETYFYHSDHLGSSSYITNAKGFVSQHMEYMPFGELLVDEHLNSNNSPYKFNAKELDQETGNYYYGARYYNPKWSTWLSVDPLAEDMPSWSSYNYAFSNPVKYSDPTGLAPEIVSAPLDDYKLVNGVIEFWRKREGEDRLYIDDKYESFSDGYLKDFSGKDIEYDGYDTFDLTQGVKLAKFVSNGLGTRELAGFACSNDGCSDEPTFLRVFPYSESGPMYDGLDSEVIFGLDSGVNFNIKAFQDESGYKVHWAFHTHPFANIPSEFMTKGYSKINGMAIPSRDDLRIANQNFANGINIPYYIFGQKALNNKGHDSSSYFGVSTDSQRFSTHSTFKLNKF